MASWPEPNLTHEDLIHDLNNVFETITEAAELLSADREWSLLAATLKRSVERGKRLVGAIPDNMPDLALVIAYATQSITDYCIASRKPPLEFSHSIAAGIRLPGRAKDWERLFANLFLNAVQAMRRPGRIEIVAEAGSSGMRITVADNGPGIPVAILEHIFQPHVSTKPNTAGRSGLGLHIVASIVQANGGRVTAANRERSSGAIFVIELPPSVG